MRALVEMQEREKIRSGGETSLLAREVHVSLDRADNVIEGGPPFPFRKVVFGQRSSTPFPT